MISRIEKRYSMNVVGPQRFQTRYFETALFADVPAEAQKQTDDGKKAFLALSDKLQSIAKAIVERDAASAVKEAQAAKEA